MVELSEKYFINSKKYTRNEKILYTFCSLYTAFGPQYGMKTVCLLKPYLSLEKSTDDKLLFLLVF